MAGKDRIVFVAVGDTSVCDGVERQIKELGADFPFAPVRPILQEADVVFGNMENVFSQAQEGIPAQAHLLRAEPATAAAVASAPFSVVSLANNHIFDFALKGIEDTVEALSARGIRSCGAGRSLQEARAPVIVERNNVRLGFLGYTTKGIQSATSDRAGAAVIDVEQIEQDILRLAGSVDHVIVSLHAGLEFIDYPHPDYRSQCHRIAAAGVSLILGHGPHVIQGVEVVNGCLICYSLGNFLFDLALMDLKTPRSEEGLLLQCRLGKDRPIEYDLLPTVINEVFQVERADPERAREIMARVERISSVLRSDEYRRTYFAQASETWSRINIAVNLKVLREQGLFAFARRLSRLKPIYILLVLKFVADRAKAVFRRVFQGKR